MTKEKSSPQPGSRIRKTKQDAYEMVRQLALAFPGVEEGVSYGSPAFRVRGKLIARLHQDGESLVIKIDYLKRDILMHAEPETFYVTDHYRCYPMMLVRLSTVRRETLMDLIEQAWRLQAPKRLVEARDGK